MYVDLKITESNSYFDHLGKEIDWEGKGGEGLIPVKQADDLQKILTAEVSIFLLRRSTGFCGSLVDCMSETHQKLIKEYNEKYEEKYINMNDSNYW